MKSGLSKILCATALLASTTTVRSTTKAQDPNDPGILEPALTATQQKEVRIPHTDQASGSTLLNLVGPVKSFDARGEASLTGQLIVNTDSPNRAMYDSLDALQRAAEKGRTAEMKAAAQSLLDILLGNTQGYIFDGFSMLNFNRGAYVPDQMPGEYKMKMVKWDGEMQPGMDGQMRKVWEANVSLLFYDGQIDSDTFLLRIPVDADEFDMIRLHYRIYSLEREDFSPTVVLQDYRLPGSVQFPFKGLDSVWVPFNGGEITEMTVDYPPVRLMRGIYTWGWRMHPPRVQFIQPVFEIVNAHTGEVELEPQGKSFAYRNAQLSIDGIGNAAPEKKMYDVARAVMKGTPGDQVYAMLTDPNVVPRGTWHDWADLAQDQLQLPDEAWDVLAGEGISKGKFGPYRFVSVYMNNEMYGEGPNGNKISGWFQGDEFQVKVINLDNHTHHFRNVDFGPKLHDDMAKGGFPAASHSFEIMNFKPTYGAPKVAELQWRAGWGFRPHFDVIQQPDVFPRPADQGLLSVFTDGEGGEHTGWQYPASVRGGDFRFNPPNFIIGTKDHPSQFQLKESDGSEGLVIGQTTEGYGIAKMCNHKDHPLGDFCKTDISQYNPYNVKNVDLDGDDIPDVLWFPPFLRNPNPDAGGDIIAPTAAWKPFLWINPNNGTLFIDPSDPSKGYWADQTYAHGRPIAAGGDLSANLLMPRASGQLFYQFDDLFHDNAIFSPHPTFSPYQDPMRLAVENLIAGARALFTTTGATPGRTVYVTYSLKGLGSTLVPSLGVTLGIKQPKLAGTDQADGAGTAQVMRTVPSGTSGVNVWLQSAEKSNVSNVEAKVIG